MEKDNLNLIPFNCPVCDGVLQEVGRNMYQCPSAHRYTLEGLIADQHLKVEKLMWALYVSMTQRTAMLTRLVQEDPVLRGRFEQQVVESTAAQAMVLGLLQMYK
jgi:hypothetical protein